MTYKQRFLWRVVILMLLVTLYGLFNLKKTNAVKNSKTSKKEAFVLIANKDLYPGYVISPGDTSWKKFPVKARPAGVVTINNLAGKKVNGMKVDNILYKNKPILKSHIKDLPQGSLLSASIQQGMVALNVKVEYDYVSSKILPGDRINLILTRKFKNDVKVDEILSNINVVDVNNQSKLNVGTKNRRRRGGEKNIELILEVPQKMGVILSEIMHQGVFKVTVSSKRDESSYRINAPKTIIHIKGTDHSVERSVVTKEGS